MYNGILIFNKPSDFTSFDVIAKLRGILRQKKIGHAGTLDPAAKGVLVILLGNATRASDAAGSKQKEYLAGLRLGVITDTQDTTGTALQTAEASHITYEMVCDAAEAFCGEINQLPPMYSAIQIDGRRLYDLARQGIEVERDLRSIEISRLEVLKPEAQDGDFLLRVVCSKGTYMRTLCHDIGTALGCGAAMSSLVRLRSGSFSLENALTFEQVSRFKDLGELEKYILPVEDIFMDMPLVIVNDEGEIRAKNGAHLSPWHLQSGELPPMGGFCRVHNQSDVFLMTGVTKALDNGQDAIFPDKPFWNNL